MAKFRSQKNAFITGEISPTAHGRTDLPQYANACKTLKNMIPLLSGGAYKRPGTLFVSSISASTDYAPRIIPFVVSNSESYALVFGKLVGGNGWIDVYRPKTDQTTVNNIATGSHPYRVATASTGIFYDDLGDVQYVQSVDVMYLVHPNSKPHKLSRTAVDTFTMAAFDDGLTGAALRDAWPYRSQNTTATTLKPSATTGSITLTSSAAFFNSKHVGALFKIKHGTTIGCAKVTAYTSNTSVSAEVVVAFGATSAETTWWESSWSDYRGWPRSVGIFNQRIVYGGNDSERDSMWFSQSFNFDVMSVSAITQSKSDGDGVSTGPKGDQPFQVTLASTQFNTIQWLSCDKSLLVGTAGEEWIVDSFENSAAGFGADNCAAVRQTAYGSDYRQPARAGNEVLFALRSGTEIRALVFNQIQNTYQADPVQIFFDEKPQIEKSAAGFGARKYKVLAWDESRKTLWCIDTRGNLFGVTKDRALQVNCWHTHELGGFKESETGGVVGSGTSATLDPAYTVCSGSVISLAVIPNPSLGMNDVWLAVKRKVNGTFKYHIERMIGGICPFTSVYDNDLPLTQSGNYYVDAASTRSNDFPLPEGFVIPSLSHLEGKPVRGTAYGASGIFTLKCGTVASGTTTVTNWPPLYNSAFFSIAIGLPYTSIVEPVRPDVGSQIGSAQGAIKRITEVFLRLYRTMNCKVGKDSGSTETIEFRSGDTPMNKSAELFTGDKRIHLNADYDRDGYVYVCSDEPLPFAVMSISSEGMTYD